MEDQRSNSRLRSLKAARIVLPGGYSTFDCMVRNLSSTGAKIVMETTVAIPDRFTLKFEDGSSHACTVQWRKATEIGAAFVD